MALSIWSIPRRLEEGELDGERLLESTRGLKATETKCILLSE